MFELLTKLSFSKGLNILLILFGSLAGPFCFVYRFYYTLYTQNSFSKILLLCAAIGVPICLVMSLFNAVIIGIPKLKEQELKAEWELKIFGMTSGFCGFVFYIACFTDWVISGIKPRDGIEVMLYTFGGAISASIFSAIRSKLKKNIR